ncbi:MAG: MgtC/SapB family protein [Desulfobacterales bacterium]
MSIIDINIQWIQVLSHLTHLAIAFLLALPIGLDRQTSSRHFGLRTYPLVSVAACGFMLVGIAVIDTTDGEARIFQGIITGIGFIGGGAIFKGENSVTGMASAASLWSTAAIGLATAFNRFEIAIVLSLLNVITLHMVGRLETKVKELNAPDPSSPDESS